MARFRVLTNEKKKKSGQKNKGTEKYVFESQSIPHFRPTGPSFFCPFVFLSLFRSVTGTYAAGKSVVLPSFGCGLKAGWLTATRRGRVSCMRTRRLSADIPTKIGIAPDSQEYPAKSRG